MRLVSFCELQANNDFDFNNNLYFYCGECFNEFEITDAFYTNGGDAKIVNLKYDEEDVGYFNVNQNALIVVYSIEEYNRIMGFDLLNENNL